MKFFEFMEHKFNRNFNFARKNILQILIVVLIMVKFCKQDLPVHCLKHDVS